MLPLKDLNPTLRIPVITYALIAASVIVLGLWFVLQLFNGVVSIGINTGASGGVAFFAHIGGFVADVVIAWIFLKLYASAAKRAAT